MAVYSSAQGVPAALVEERDACGVGFIASMDQRKTHDILKQSLNALTCMEHRGATSADNVSGDGAGIMTDIPWKLFEREGVDVGAVKNADGSDATGVGQMFMPHEDTKEAMAVVDAAAETLGLNVLMWRDVPVNEQVLGELSRGFVPVVKQIVLQARTGLATSSDFDKVLYECRRLVQANFRNFSPERAVNSYVMGIVMFMFRELTFYTVVVI